MLTNYGGFLKYIKIYNFLFVFADIRPFVRFIAKCTARTLEAYIWSTKDNSLAPFGDESETIRSPKEAMDHLSYHDAIISGGSLGPNITVEAP